MRMIHELKDGDILFVHQPDQKTEKWFEGVRRWQQLASVIEGRPSWGNELHVMVYVDLRSKFEQLDRSGGVPLGSPMGHAIHFGRAGLVESVLEGAHGHHASTMTVLRCQDRQWAELAATTAVELLLNSTNVMYEWKLYRQMAAGSLARAAKYAGYAWTTYNIASALYTGGLAGLANLLTLQSLQMTSITLLMQKSLEYLSEGA